MLAYFLAALQDDRTKTHMGQNQRREQSAGAGADHDRPGGQVFGRPGYKPVSRIRRQGNMRGIVQALQEGLLIVGFNIEAINQENRTSIAGINTATKYRIIHRCSALRPSQSRMTVLIMLSG